MDNVAAWMITIGGLGILGFLFYLAWDIGKLWGILLLSLILCLGIGMGLAVTQADQHNHPHMAEVPCR
jgi:hypothetical protein